MALIDTRNSAHDFSVKFSPCMCSQTDSSCPGGSLAWSHPIPQELIMRDKTTIVIEICSARGQPAVDDL